VKRQVRFFIGILFAGLIFLLLFSMHGFVVDSLCIFCADFFKANQNWPNMCPSFQSIDDSPPIYFSPASLWNSLSSTTSYSKALKDKLKGKVNTNFTVLQKLHTCRQLLNRK